MQGIQIAVHQVGAKKDITLLVVSGFVDTTTCQELAKAIQDLIKQKKIQIIVDLSRVNYISSAGWGVFVGEIKNVRDLGGDLKLVQMTPEVAEVFEMLEFNRVLNSYETLAEAIDEFDLLRGIDITQVEKEVSKSIPTAVSLPIEKIPLPPNFQIRTSQLVEKESETIPLYRYPLVERIKRIILENPLAGISTIRRKLRSDLYGNVHIGYFRLFSILRKMNLETKEKRYRFYRSR